MSGLNDAIVQIQALRRKFDGLLDTARNKTRPAPQNRTPGTKGLQELTTFGRNPGNLRMFMHIPERLPSKAPLVVALHGCSQTAEEYDRGSGWSSLADRLGFAVLYPEQQPVNNPKNCFSWFLPGDVARDQGEALSIQQMVDHAIVTFGLNRRQVFVTGLSAGGAMASVMLATYPEVFAGGAIIAGIPYGAARSVQEALEAMFTDQSPSARTLGDRVRAAAKHSGPWPKISVWHGTVDPIVKPSNSENIVRQWTNLHGLSAAPSYEEAIGNHSRRVWNDAEGNALIEAFSVSGMAHGVPLASATGEEGYGEAGAFFLDAGISSTHHIANFWRLGDGLVETSPALDMAAEPNQIESGGRAVVVTERVGGDPDEAASEPNAEQKAHRASDPAHVIAAAFKAAGLAVPKLPIGPASAAPGPIIAAALKAAGLTRT